VLGDLQRRGLRPGVISNTGDDDGAAVNEVLRAAGLLSYFDPSLLIYSKDVGLTKDSPEIFRRAAERAGFADAPRRCVFVGEDAKERGFALDAGWRVAPHPLLVAEVLAGQQLQYVRVTVPARYATSSWRDALRALPLVPLHVTGAQGTTVYAVTSLRVVPTIMNMRFELELLGAQTRRCAPISISCVTMRQPLRASCPRAENRRASSPAMTTPGWC
jgi:leucyl aminopeptidase